MPELAAREKRLSGRQRSPCCHLSFRGCREKHNLTLDKTATMKHKITIHFFGISTFLLILLANIPAC